MPGRGEDTSVDLVLRWRDGDQQAADELFRRYADRLVALAHTRLSAKMALRSSAEDVVQSAYRSFFVHARAGRYSLERSGDLWRLLVAITLHKVRGQVEHHTADKRSIHLERDTPTDDGWFGLAPQLLAQDPSPEEAAALADQVEEVMNRLDLLHRRILELRLQGYNLEEIATDVGRSIRTVKRGLSHIREQLAQQHHND
jgi:RNA polymerase sigma-70 factor (ECF subfamily)